MVIMTFRKYSEENLPFRYTAAARDLSRRDAVLLPHGRAWPAHERMEKRWFSQFLIRSAIYEGLQEPQELFFCILLFKLFNHVETRQLLQREVGPPHTAASCVQQHDCVLSAAMARGTPVYSAAYGRAFQESLR